MPIFFPSNFLRGVLCLWGLRGWLLRCPCDSSDFTTGKVCVAGLLGKLSPHSRLVQISLLKEGRQGLRHVVVVFVQICVTHLGVFFFRFLQFCTLCLVRILFPAGTQLSVFFALNSDPAPYGICTTMSLSLQWPAWSLTCPITGNATGHWGVSAVTGFIWVGT